MHRALLGLAAMSAAVAISSPACAQSAVASSGFSAMTGTQSGRILLPSPRGDFRHPDPGTGHHRHNQAGDGRVAAGWGYSGYNDYGDYDANRSFDPDKWNDWWHERPERAFPRWVWSNQNCTEDRMWWSGSGWRCTP